mmetsp:Transcript_27490/g.110110  ORF Transcript_27490/g.110110 Transcript_27490/m.110110 type:complete len:251 (+) Transcript_27490:111-863(+)
MREVSLLSLGGSTDRTQLCREVIPRARRDETRRGETRRGSDHTIREKRVTAWAPAPDDDDDDDAPHLKRNEETARASEVGPRPAGGGGPRGAVEGVFAAAGGTVVVGARTGLPLGGRGWFLVIKVHGRVALVVGNGRVGAGADEGVDDRRVRREGRVDHLEVGVVRLGRGCRRSGVRLVSRRCVTVPVSSRPTPARLGGLGARRADDVEVLAQQCLDLGLAVVGEHERRVAVAVLLVDGRALGDQRRHDI